MEVLEKELANDVLVLLVTFGCEGMGALVGAWGHAGVGCRSCGWSGG